MIVQKIQHRIHFGFCRFRTALKQSFSSIPASWKGKLMPPRPSVAENEIVEVFLKGSGPGGQKINKTASAVQLRHLPTGLVVKSQATRSREQNRKIARNILATKLDELFNGTESRHAKLVERAQKKKASKTKKAKRKYAKLGSGKKELEADTAGSFFTAIVETALKDGSGNDGEISWDVEVTSGSVIAEGVPKTSDETSNGAT